MEEEKYSKEEEEGEMCEGGVCGQCSGMECGGYEMGCGGHGMGCQRMFGMGCRGRHHLLRWGIGIALLAIIFAAGIKIGEFKERMTGGGYGAERGYNAGYNMMQRGYNNAPEVYFYRSGMMQGLGGAPVQQQVPTR